LPQLGFAHLFYGWS